MNIDDLEDLDETTQKQIIEWQKVTRKESGNDAYALVQLRLGNILYGKNNIREALEAWHNINETDIREIFISAQWNISIELMKNNNLEKALLIWRSIKESDDSELYAQAQWNIGLSFDNAGNIGEALRIWSYIEKTEYTAAVYAVAQLNIGLILSSMGYVKAALNIWSNIERSDNPEKYVKAKWIIGVNLVTLEENEKALSEWREIKNTDDPDIYVKSQYQIGKILAIDSSLKNYTEAKQAFINAENYFPYEVSCYKKILNLMLEPDSVSIGEKILLLLVNTLEIIEILKLDFSQNSNEEKSPERKLAHYTGTYITNLLLETNDKIVSSSFRLNTINNVNDPSEGHLLINYLNNTKEGYFRAPDFDGKLHAFISCFTFNHDSLNQFRLYGKEADKEASGVSLVFGSNFFQSNEYLRGLSFLSLASSVENSDEEFVIEKDYKHSIVGQVSDGRLRISKQPVMRCIYLDPTSNYVQLAQRNRITFFREFGKEIIEIEGIEISKAEHEWKKYRDYINQKTKVFEYAFITLKNIYSSIIEEKINIQEGSFNIANDVDVLLNEILLPFKYLIKHSAFQEEQECRMIYITSIDAPEVMMQHKKLLFVEYQAGVKESLNKVYIAPAATEYQLYLAWLLRNTNVKIELSNNPYRQT